MKHEVFSQDSNNPRLRRAFAHAKLAQLAHGANISDEAKEAVKATGSSKKSVNSNFGRALLSASIKGGSERHRQQIASERGLPAEATWSDISAAGSERSRQWFATDYGLPAEATWSDISAAGSERSRQHFAIERGLPADATWSDISAQSRQLS